MGKKDKAPSKKLVLNRATLRNLTSTELKGVVGGMINQSRVTECDCPSFMCDTTDNTGGHGVSRAGTACTQP